MAELTTDCPRCNSASVTFDLVGANATPLGGADWQDGYEAFCRCRRCLRSTIFLIRLNKYEVKGDFNTTSKLSKDVNLSRYFEIRGFVNIKDHTSVTAPNFTPDPIARTFNEGATCLAVNCWNAAATMFRLCLDLATKPLLPSLDDEGPQPNSRQRRDLGLRIPWLLDKNRLPQELRDLADCIREDANDGAHQGNLTETDASDIMDFTAMVLERLFTEPGRIEAAKKRREERRSSAKAPT